MTIIAGPAPHEGGAHPKPQRDARDRRALRSAQQFRLRQIMRAAATCSASVLALAALWLNRPPAPDWHSFGGPSTATWDVVGLVGSTLVVVAVVALAYLTAVAGANLLIGLATSTTAQRDRPAGRAVRLTRRTTPRWLAAAALGLAAASASVPSAGAAEGPTDPATITLEELSEAAVPASENLARTMLPWATDLRYQPTATAPAVTSTPTTAPESPVSPESPGSPESPVVPVAPAGATPSPAPSAPTTHSVEPGEHFWAIAERIVAERGQREPVAHYWSRLVEENRDRLIDPTDPSLLHVGQLIVIPD